MADVVLSGAIRSNLLSMQNTQKMLSETNLRLSTGLKVNSAIDNPTAYFTAQGLNNRASDLNTLLDSMGQSIQTLKAADEGITSIQKLVESLKATANQALETKISATTLTGKASTEVVGTGTTASGATNTLTDTSRGFTSGETITLTVGEKTFDFAITASSDVKSLVDAINNDAGGDLTGEGVTASIEDGQLHLEAASGRAVTVTTDSADNTALSKLLGTKTSSSNGVNRDKYERDFNNLREQIQQLADDASYKGVNLLKGDLLSVFFNEDQSSKMDIEGVELTPDGLLNIASVGATDGNHEFETDSNITALINGLNSTTDVLRQQASTFGGNLGVVEIRQDFTKNLVDTLQTGASNLTLADTNEEGAKLLALQTRQQLGTTALSLANQAEQGVLRLFG